MTDSSVPGSRNYYGRVRAGGGPNATTPPASSLVTAFGAEIENASDAVVLRGYAGKSTVIDRALEFLKIAGRNGMAADEVAAGTAQVEGVRALAERNLVRIYLTPRLDRYVDFHRLCLIAWRREASPSRQDMVTVWLRRYDLGGVPIVYRAIDEATIGSPPAAYLGGDLLDDYLDQTGSQAGAWGSQAGGNLGNKPWTHTTGC